MRLFQGGYADYQFFTVASTQQEAVEKIQKIDGMAWLPVTVKPIDSIDGYTLSVSKEANEDGAIANSSGNKGAETAKTARGTNRNETTKHPKK